MLSLEISSELISNYFVVYLSEKQGLMDVKWENRSLVYRAHIWMKVPWCFPLTQSTAFNYLVKWSPWWDANENPEESVSHNEHKYRCHLSAFWGRSITWPLSLREKKKTCKSVCFKNGGRRELHWQRHYIKVGKLLFTKRRKTIKKIF